MLAANQPLLAMDYAQRLLAVASCHVICHPFQMANDAPCMQVAVHGLKASRTAAAAAAAAAAEVMSLSSAQL